MSPEPRLDAQSVACPFAPPLVPDSFRAYSNVRQLVAQPVRLRTGRAKAYYWQRDLSAFKPTRIARQSVESPSGRSEGSVMRANRLGFIGGLILFLASLVLLLFLRIPSLGRWDILIGALAFVAMLVAAGYLTRGWWAPGLTAAGGLLELASEFLFNVATAEGGAVGLLLIFALSVVGFVLASIGLVVMAIGAVRRWRERNRET